jgi:16S rRNA (cytidine1402-2'-O)-methyltransferase
MIFDCNDRPGIMLSSAVRKYLNHYAVKCGNNVVIFSNNDDAYETALSLHAKGIKIKAIIDIRKESQGELVKKCIEEKISVYSVPGASSVLGSIVISGIDTSKFTFLGFFPQVKKLKEAFLERIIDANETIILYESPRRLLKLLKYFIDNIPNRKIAVVRELTKKNEEVVRGSPEFIYSKFYDRLNIKGEITLVIEGVEFNKKNHFNNEEIIALINLYKGTISDKDIVKKISNKFNLSKRVIYQLIIDNK